MSNPVTYNLQNDADAARFGLDKWERDYLMTRCFPNRRYGGVQGRIEALVGHIQDGTTSGSLDWWVHGPGVEASASVLTTQKGELIRCIPKQHGPWTNGAVRSPTARAAEVIARGGNVNIWTWSCEAEGRTWDAFTPAHWETICWAFDEQLQENPHLDPRLDIIGHKDVDSVKKTNCGLYVDRLIAEMIGDYRPSLDRIGTITNYASPIAVVVTASAGLNLRNWGQLDQPIITTVPAGTVLTAVAEVVGDTVAGISRWYIDPKGRRFWSGGTNQPRT